MHFMILALLASVATSVSAQGPAVFVATTAERASGFKDLADCQRNIAATPQRDAKVQSGKHDGGHGSVFNRAHGNVTRCEMVEGEAMVVVYPRGHGASAL